MAGRVGCLSSAAGSRSALPPNMAPFSPHPQIPPILTGDCPCSVLSHTLLHLSAARSPCPPVRSRPCDRFLSKPCPFWPCLQLQRPLLGHASTVEPVVLLVSDMLAYPSSAYASLAMYPPGSIARTASSLAGEREPHQSFNS